MKNFIIVGFKDEAKLVKDFARRLKASAYLVQAGKFRAGEMKITGPAKTPRRVIVVANVWENPDSLFRVLLLAHELRSAGAKRLDLIAPWIAYGRQDRATKPGEEPAGIMVGRLLSAMYDKIVTLDAHSPAFIDGFNGKLVNVTLWRKMRTKDVDLVAAPDGGATSRASFAAESLSLPFVVVEKRRTASGGVASKLPTGTKLKGARILLVDDMADSGGTLKAAAQELKKAGVVSISVIVAHAFDLKRLKHHLRLEIKHAAAAFDHKSGKIASDTLDSLAQQITLV